MKDHFSHQGTWQLCESVEGQPSFDRDVYLAKLRGPIALVDGVSLNNRYYSKTLWENVIRENSDKIHEEGLFGTISHDVEMDEAAIADGQITHKVTNMWIDEASRTVQGEILVLNSSAGRNLNTYLRSGMKISTSSRAYGRFKGKTSSGADIIDETGFTLQGFDFVLNPGVQAATPKLVETAPSKEENKMDEKVLLESLQDRSKLMIELSEANKGKESAERKLQEALDTKAALEKELNEAKQQSGRVSAFLKKTFGPKPIETIKSLNEGIAKWLMIPEFQEYAREMGMFDTLGTSFEETLKKLTEAHKEHARIGTPEGINKCLDLLEAFKGVGQNPKELTESLQLLEKFQKLGKFEDVEKQLAEATKIREAYRQGKRMIAVKKICRGLNLYEQGASEEETKKLNEAKEQMVLGMVTKMPVKDVIKALRSVRGKTVTNEAAPAAGKKVPTTKKPEAGEASRALKLVESIVPLNIVTAK